MCAPVLSPRMSNSFHAKMPSFFFFFLFSFFVVIKKCLRGIVTFLNRPQQNLIFIKYMGHITSQVSAISLLSVMVPKYPRES